MTLETQVHLEQIVHDTAARWNASLADFDAGRAPWSVVELELRAAIIDLQDYAYSVLKAEYGPEFHALPAAAFRTP